MKRHNYVSTYTIYDQTPFQPSYIKETPNPVDRTPFQNPIYKPNQGDATDFQSQDTHEQQEHYKESNDYP